MRISNIDHFVITTADLEVCLRFYVGLLGLKHEVLNGHHNLLFPHGKISLHTQKGEFQPAATNPEYGAQDFCLVVEDDLQEVLDEIVAKGYKIEEGIVTRHGSQGVMQSLYLRDPDGNLVELSRYLSM